MLKKKTAVLTGSNRGIGKEILKLFAENNANIMLAPETRMRNISTL